ncbi:MAG TPA: Zn-ribbon domain-containing OB-fold protein [Blastocatellia bacterium]|jgi:uncharacterized OB-fold protein/putative sterol carrier protein
MILEGNITIPYKWTTGAAIGRFLGELRDNAKIFGARCGACAKVYVPPPDVCGECFKPLSDWVELSGEGTVIAASIVEYGLPWSHRPVPYTLALIKLDGADTNMIHLASADVVAGVRVRAAFKQERGGSILDIDCFVPIVDVGHADGTLREGLGESIERGESDGGKNEPGGVKIQMESITEVSEVFRLLPARFREGKTEKELSYYFSIEGEQWTVFVGPDRCEVKRGKVIENADCFLKTSAEIFLGTVSGEYTPSMMDFIRGRIKTNSPALLQTFKDIFG